MAPDTDIVIIGGGPVGAALALALRETDLRVTVLEARADPAAASGERGSRPIALSHGSRLLLERLNAWHELSPTPIEHIHVSQRGAFGRVALNAADAGVPALGYVVDYSEMDAALTRAAGNTNSDYRTGASVNALRPADESCRIEYTLNGTPATLTARLAVVADGGDIEGLAPVKVVDYGQVALTARVRTTRLHGNTAYERFTRDGPLALLPFGSEMALVWTLTPDAANTLKTADSPAFLAALRDAFGGRLGEFVAVDERACYPLALRHATGRHGGARDCRRQCRADAASGGGAGLQSRIARRVGTGAVAA